MAGKVTVGLAESNGSLPLASWYARVSLWAWWEVVAAHHWVHDHACCHLQTDCLESGISSDPYALLWVWVPLPLFYLWNYTAWWKEHVSVINLTSSQRAEQLGIKSAMSLTPSSELLHQHITVLHPRHRDSGGWVRFNIPPNTLQVILETETVVHSRETNWSFIRHR